MEKSKRLTDDYEMISLNGIACNLGFGAYGSVQLAKCLRTNRTVAVKKIFRKLAVNQVDIHYSMSHHNIVKLLDFYFDQQNLATYIVLQYAQNGTLFEFIKEHGLRDKRLLKNIFRSVCEAIQYMHSKGIMHRDIKPQNILLDKNNNVKLCDFGFAANFQPRMTLCGTAEYMSPQMILRKKHSHKIDVWSLGILLFELIQGHAPFQGQNQDQILQKMKMALYFSDKFSDEEIQLIHSILKVDARQRPEVSTILGSLYLSYGKRHSEEVSKRSTMEEQKQSKIKIIGVRHVHPEDDIHSRYAIKPFMRSSQNCENDMQPYSSKPLIGSSQDKQYGHMPSMRVCRPPSQPSFQDSKISLKKQWRKS